MGFTVSLSQLKSLTLGVCMCVDVKQAAPVMARMPAVQASAAAAANERSMANVKALRLRLASVKSIQRITKTMKMVAASKLKGFKTRMLEVLPLFLFMKTPLRFYSISPVGRI